MSQGSGLGRWGRGEGAGMGSWQKQLPCVASGGDRKSCTLNITAPEEKVCFSRQKKKKIKEEKQRDQNSTPSSERGSGCSDGIVQHLQTRAVNIRWREVGQVGLRKKKERGVRLISS